MDQYIRDILSREEQGYTMALYGNKEVINTQIRSDIYLLAKYIKKQNDILESWHETHFEITEAIINALDNNNNEALKIHENFGRGGLYEYAKELTDKFEIKFKDEIWGETLEYMDEIEKFIEQEIYNNNHKIDCKHPFNKLHHEKDGFLCMECGQFIKNM